MPHQRSRHSAANGARRPNGLSQADESLDRPTRPQPAGQPGDNGDSIMAGGFFPFYAIMFVINLIIQLFSGGLTDLFGTAV